MPPGTNLMAISDALTSISSTAKLIPGAGDTVAGVLDLASEICKMVQDVKSNKKAVEKLAVRASGTLAAITDIIQRADQGKRPQYEVMVKELCSVYQEMKNTTEKLTKQNRVCQFINRSQIKETLTDLDGKLIKASSDFQVQTAFMNTITIDTVKDLCTVIRQEQIKMKQQADKRDAEMLQAAADAEQRDREAAQRQADLAADQQKTIAAVEEARKLALLDKLNPVAADWNSHTVDTSISCCLVDTRVQILEDIHNWASSGTTNSSPSVFWLSGLAGTGKSTIARTVCQLFESRSMTCVSFFFSRQSPERRDPVRVVCSLAFQLARFDNTLRATICSAIEETPDVASRSISEQIRLLLAVPLSRCVPLSRPLVFVLDALDECDKHNDKEGGPLLPLLVACIGRLSVSCSVRLLVTSRGEPSILAMFNEIKTTAPNIIVRLHEIGNSTVQHDIVKYLESKLREISSRRPDLTDWPQQADIDALATRAGVLFVYAATLVRYVDSILDDPKDLLCSIIDGTVAESEGVYDVVDQLYSQIFDRAVGFKTDPQHRHCQRLRDVVGSLVLLRRPLSPTSLARLIDQKVEHVNRMLLQFSSVLIMCESTPVTVFHPSFPDFITDWHRCKDDRFYVDSRSFHATLAQRCLVLMNRHLTRDICGIKDPSLFNSEVADLPERLRRDIPDELAYACRYWAEHIDRSLSEHTGSDHSELLIFCRTKLLAWVEVLSLMGILHLSYGLLDLAKKYCNKSKGQNLTDAAALLDDLNYMIREFYPAINDSALHIYYSAVPMMSQCPLLDLYLHESHSAVRLLTERPHGWRRQLLHTFHTGPGGRYDLPGLLIFLPDNRHVLCSLTDTKVSCWTMEIWDMTTGKSLRTSEKLQSDKQKVAVSLSPDGTRLVSTYSGSHAQIWSTATAQIILELRECNTAPPEKKKLGHSCNAFSPDGQYIAVSLDGCSVQIWNAYTGALQTSLPKDCRDLQYIEHLIWSSDCRSLICVFARRLCIWDIKTGSVIAEIQPIWRAHLRLLMSPTLTDCIGTLVHHGDKDHNGYATVTFKVWAMNGVLEREVLINRKFNVETVYDPLVFSADGKMMLTRYSCRRGNELALWDLSTGSLLGVLQHSSTEDIWSYFNISDDGSRVVACSAPDGTIRVWDTQTRMGVLYLMGDGQFGHSLSISPDCSRLVSFSSERKLLRLWDVSPLSQAVPGERETFYSVSVCDDGNCIVSVSKEGRMTVWDAQTWQPIVHMKRRHQHTQLSISADGSHTIGDMHYYSGFSPGNVFVCVWDSATGECAGRLAMLHDGSIDSLSLSKDGFVAVVASSTVLHIWNVRDDQVISRISPTTGTAVGVHQTVMSPDGSHVATYISHTTYVELPMREHEPIQVYDVVSCQLLVSMSPPVLTKRLGSTVYTQLKYLRDGTLYAFEVESNGMQSTLHAWHKDSDYRAIVRHLPIMYVKDSREGSHWILRVVNGDIATSRRLCWLPPDRYRPLKAVGFEAVGSSDNSPGHIMAFLNGEGHLTVLDFADVAHLMSLL